MDLGREKKRPALRTRADPAAKAYGAKAERAPLDFEKFRPVRFEVTERNRRSGGGRAFWKRAMFSQPFCTKTR